MARPDRIEWQAFLRAKDQRSVDKLLVRIQEALAIPLNVVEVERYWKDSALYECRFTTMLGAIEGAAWVTDSVLAQAGKLALFWNVGAVRPGEDFWGSSTGGVFISGVEDISFALGRP